MAQDAGGSSQAGGAGRAVKMTPMMKIGWTVALALAVAFFGFLVFIRPNLDVGAKVGKYCGQVCPEGMNFTTYQDDKDQIYCVCHAKGTKCNHLVSFSNPKEAPADFCYDMLEAW